MPRALREGGHGWERAPGEPGERTISGEASVRWRRPCTSSGGDCPGCRARLMRRSAEPSFAALGSGYDLVVGRASCLESGEPSKLTRRVPRTCAWRRGSDTDTDTDTDTDRAVLMREALLRGEHKRTCTHVHTYLHTYYSWAREALFWSRGSGLSSTRVRYLLGAHLHASTRLS